MRRIDATLSFMQVQPADDQAMQRALELAAIASERGEIPVGALLIDPAGKILAESGNLNQTNFDPTAHAEIEVIRAACTKLQSSRLDNCSLVVTLEPCPMCAGAAMQARIGRLVFGADNKDYGAAGSMFDVMRDGRLPHRAEVVANVRAAEATKLLDKFFDAKR
jgi:tRNA(adenine34) deaminase